MFKDINDHVAQDEQYSVLKTTWIDNNNDKSCYDKKIRTLIYPHCISNNTSIQECLLVETIGINTKSFYLCICSLANHLYSYTYFFNYINAHSFYSIFILKKDATMTICIKHRSSISYTFVFIFCEIIEYGILIEMRIWYGKLYHIIKVTNFIL